MHFHGDYGVTVNTEVCGTFDLGSIPSSPPIIKSPLWAFYYWGTKHAKSFACVWESKSFSMF